MFLLAPDDLSSGVLTQLSLQGNEWEWSQLLKSHDGDVLLAKFLALINQIIINLARAEDHLARGSWLDLCFGDHSVEGVACRELFNVRAGILIL
jgi:hypothetical protein